MSNLVRVALRKSTLDFDKLYIYEDPFNTQLGQRVVVPFGRGNRLEEAFIIERLDHPWLPEALAPRDELPRDKEKIKSLLSVKEETCWLNQAQCLLAAQMRLRYNCSWSQAIGLMLPPLDLPAQSREQYYYLTNPDVASEQMINEEITTVEQMAVVSVLLDYEAAIQRSELMAVANVSDSPLRTLKKKGIVASASRENLPPHLRSLAMEEHNMLPKEDEIPEIYRSKKILSAGQQRALDTLLEAPGEYLLQGITGSGKTEVYLEFTEQLLKQGKSVIVLVPEIALTTQMIQRFTARLGTSIALWHSRLSPRERQVEWQKVATGQAQIVLGARSAVFMPMQNLAAIILDEAHEPAFLSEQTPRYHATTVARLRMQAEGGSLILGSATPSSEDYARALEGKSQLIQLKERAGKGSTPKLHPIDLKRYIPTIYQQILSPPLIKGLQNCFARGEQAMLFLNRRGYAAAYLCEDCGEQIECPRCTARLHAHLQDQRMVCHYCGLMLKPITKCPSCGGPLRQVGIGTQQLEQVCKKLFLDVSIARMDQDSTRHRKAYDEILGRFRSGDIQLLIGTQMIAKGHDFPNLTVVGILGVDQMLSLPSFRAEERAYQLIVQAAGRAGRSPKGGEVYIQAYDIKHPVIQHVIHGTYESFMQENLAQRRRLHHPPYGAIGQVHLSSLNETLVHNSAQHIYRVWQKIKLPHDLRDEQPELMAPAPAPIAMIRNRYRYLLTIKSPNEFLITRYLKLALQIHDEPQVRISVELDPA